MQTAKDIAASAKSGMDKTKAVVQEKVEKMTAGDPLQKEMATQKKEERIHAAEREKLQMKEEARMGRGAGGAYTHSTTGTVGQPTGGHQMSALPGHGRGEPVGHVTEGTMGSHPIGTTTGTNTGRPTAAHNTHVGGGTNTTGYGTGGAYSG